MLGWVCIDRPIFLNIMSNVVRGQILGSFIWFDSIDNWMKNFGRGMNDCQVQYLRRSKCGKIFILFVFFHWRTILLTYLILEKFQEIKLLYNFLWAYWNINFWYWCIETLIIWNLSKTWRGNLVNKHNKSVFIIFLLNVSFQSTQQIVSK